MIKYLSSVIPPRLPVHLLHIDENEEEENEMEAILVDLN